MADQKNIVVKSYTGNQERAARAFQEDAASMAAKGYFPITQSYQPGAYGCGAFIVALVLCFVLVGILIFIYMLLVKPDGVLTVTYEFRGTAATRALDEKTCPKCAEQVKAAATVCRFCGHQFTIKPPPATAEKSLTHDELMAKYGISQGGASSSAGADSAAPDPTRKCPFCAETIKLEAKLCRYCARDLPEQERVEVPQKHETSEQTERAAPISRVNVDSVQATPIREANLHVVQAPPIREVNFDAMQAALARQEKFDVLRWHRELSPDAEEAAPTRQIFLDALQTASQAKRYWPVLLIAVGVAILVWGLYRETRPPSREHEVQKQERDEAAQLAAPPPLAPSPASAAIRTPASTQGMSTRVQTNEEIHKQVREALSPLLSDADAAVIENVWFNDNVRPPVACGRVNRKRFATTMDGTRVRAIDDYSAAFDDLYSRYCYVQ